MKTFEVKNDHGFVWTIQSDIGSVRYESVESQPKAVLHAFVTDVIHDINDVTVEAREFAIDTMGSLRGLENVEAELTVDMLIDPQVFYGGRE